jgi:ABC-type xylose transport system permease subunit
MAVLHHAVPGAICFVVGLVLGFAIGYVVALRRMSSWTY